VVASDTDTAAGVAAVWLARVAGRPGRFQEICQYERMAGTWRRRRQRNHAGLGAAIS
jgi:hypothetical protein